MNRTCKKPIQSKQHIGDIFSANEDYTDFNLWAKAVREQMMDCLRKRQKT